MNQVWQSVCVHYSVAICTLSIEEKPGHCICLAVLYENLALLTGHRIYPAVLYEILALLTGQILAQLAGHCVGYAVLCLDYGIATV